MRFLGKLKRKRVSVPDIEQRIACFREILNANNNALGLVAEIKEALESKGPLAASRVRRGVSGVTVQTFRMLSNLELMTGNRRYKKLTVRFNDLKTRIASRFELAPVLNRESLESVLPHIIPLTLNDRMASGYSASRCRTIHDVIRFCQQAAIEEMFDLGDRALRSNQFLWKLVSPVPIDCRILDLGGGIIGDREGDSVALEEVACRPMRSLWRGMTDPRLHWGQPRPMSVRGFMSAVVDYNFDPDARLRSMGEPSYVFITDDYMNLNSRVGYHFSTVDACVCDTIESNYACLRFAGGSTGIEQRSRRALLIQELLAAGGFETDRSADLVNARIRHLPPGEMDGALSKMGLLIGYVNHLDMALVSDEVMSEYREAFMAGNYGYGA